MLKRSLLITLIAFPLAASAAHAQSWDTPMFYSPRPMDDIGLYYFHVNEDFCSTDCLLGRESSYQPNGLKLIWRQTGNINLGVQAGFGDLKDIGGSVLLAMEAGNTLQSFSANGLAAAWSLGAGAVFGKHYIDLAIPLGVSVGLNLGSGSTSFVPYVHPRVSFDLASVDKVSGNGSITNTDVGLAVDLGAEIGLGQTLVARAAYTVGSTNNTIGKRNAFGAGLALRIPRKVVARGR